jgi:hypothetical protein
MQMYFGSRHGNWDAYISRAYLDMSRTLHHFSQCGTKDALKKAARRLMRDELNKLANHEDAASRGFFDKWHAITCEKLVNVFPKSKSSNAFAFRYGQAQKWLNMTIKYSWLFADGDRLEDWYPFAHFPLDEYILRAAKRKKGIKRPKDSWSRLDQVTYSDYQKQLLQHLDNRNDPLTTEHAWWLEEWKADKERREDKST